MVQSIFFNKMHGLGNDFVIVNSNDLSKDISLPQLAIKISNRFTGIGCDQFIIYTHINNNNYLMHIYNKDGSLAETCGNAARCLTQLLCNIHEHKTIKLTISDRTLDCWLLSDNIFSVNMGKASFNKEWMPQIQKIWEITDLFQLERKEIICVDVGNPHIIIFGKLNSKEQEIISHQLTNSSLFSQGVNINFADIIDQKIYLIVFERGAGITLACGSGACATFAAANKLGFINDSAEVNFHYGALQMSKRITKHQEEYDIIMSGPAEQIANGKYYL